jgi:hypothetical protein
MRRMFLLFAVLMVQMKGTVTWTCRTHFACIIPCDRRTSRIRGTNSRTLTEVAYLDVMALFTPRETQR